MSSKFKRILYVAHDQLNARYGVLAEADAESDLIVLVESQRMITGADWHPEKLFFVLSSARHFAEELKSHGFTVDYVKAPDTATGLQTIQREKGGIDIHCAEPSSYRLTKSLTDIGVIFVENDFFLTPRKLFAEWAQEQKSFLMENFYRLQRKRLNLLMDGNQPRGGQWNFDKDNRLPPPKNYDWPEYLSHSRDDVDREVSAELGYVPSTTWATNRAGALLQLEHFVQNHLAGFGPYEDAVSHSSWSMHHSLLSPYLNNGLLHAEEVVERAITEFNKSDVPLASIEAFVRQIIGWREYINGMYWYLGAEYRNMNTLEMDSPLPPAFRDSSSTKMNCISGVIKDVEERSWTHHIPRLMILSNFAQLVGVSPQDVLKWMREVFIDATDWVMVPNMIGMGMHADGGVMMTKPYISGGAYISRMTQYCGSCIYNPKLRVGDDACPFTTMYWDYLDRYRDEFAGNHRMAQPYANLARLSDLDEVKLRANAVREGISRGEI